MQHARDAVADAEAYLEEIKSRMPNGQIWWMERELHEAKAYLPQAKGTEKHVKKRTLYSIFYP